jgi:predicted RNase H-like nuclease (RuvC/YqgF family)
MAKVKDTKQKTDQKKKEIKRKELKAKEDLEALAQRRKLQKELNEAEAQSDSLRNKVFKGTDGKIYKIIRSGPGVYLLSYLYENYEMLFECDKPIFEKLSKGAVFEKEQLFETQNWFRK